MSEVQERTRSCDGEQAVQKKGEHLIGGGFGQRVEGTRRGKGGHWAVTKECGCAAMKILGSGRGELAWQRHLCGGRGGLRD